MCCPGGLAGRSGRAGRPGGPGCWSPLQEIMLGRPGFCIFLVGFIIFGSFGPAHSQSQLRGQVGGDTEGGISSSVMRCMHLVIFVLSTVFDTLKRFQL